jgi:hypothetical protein
MFDVSRHGILIVGFFYPEKKKKKKVNIKKEKRKRKKKKANSF